MEVSSLGAQQGFWHSLIVKFGLNKQRLLGLSFIVAVAVIWVVASFVVQDIEASGAHPAVLTFIANSLFSVFIPIHFLNQKLRAKKQHSTWSYLSSSMPTEDDPIHIDQNTQILDPITHTNHHQQLSSTTTTISFSSPTFKHLLRAALIIAPLWYLAQLTFNTSLELTSVTSNTILSSTSVLFTFIFSVVFLGEAFTLKKLAYLLLLIVGTALVTTADTHKSSDTTSRENIILTYNKTETHNNNNDNNDNKDSSSLSGDLLCLLSSSIYGMYTVAIQKLLQEDDSMSFFFGLMGSIIFFVVGPLLSLGLAFGAHLSTLTAQVLGLIVIKGLADNVLSDYLWARAILLVGPTAATAGLALQIPLAVLLDAVFGDPMWMRRAGSAVLTFIGAGVILTGFFGILIETKDNVTSSGGSGGMKELKVGSIGEGASDRQQEEGESSLGGSAAES